MSRHVPLSSNHFWDLASTVASAVPFRSTTTSKSPYVRTAARAPNVRRRLGLSHSSLANFIISSNASSSKPVPSCCAIDQIDAKIRFASAKLSRSGTRSYWSRCLNLKSSVDERTNKGKETKGKNKKRNRKEIHPLTSVLHRKQIIPHQLQLDIVNRIRYRRTD